MNGVRLTMTGSRQISFKAVTLGVLTDVLGSLTVMTTVGLIVGLALGAQDVPQVELELQMQRPGFLVPSLLLGLGFTTLGGFVAGRVSGRFEMIHGGLVGSVCLIVGILLWPVSASVPAWYMVVSLLGSVPLGLLGGYLAGNTRGVPLL
jgi:hypothetical protein